MTSSLLVNYIGDGLYTVCLLLFHSLLLAASLGNHSFVCHDISYEK